MTTIEDPDAADLLATARRTILEDVAPALSGDARFRALMAANAIGIALRATDAARAEIAAAAAALGDPRALIGRIRAGALDPGAEDHAATHAALLRLAEASRAVSAGRKER